MRVYDEARTGAVLRARQLRRDSTDAERRLLRALRSKLPEFKWRHQMPIGPYFADLACFAEKLVIELDGGQHAEAGDYDIKRTRFMEARGYRVLRFWNNDALANTDGVLEQISLSLGRGKEPRQRREGEADRTSALTNSSSPSRGFAAHPSPVGRGRP